MKRFLKFASLSIGVTSLGTFSMAQDGVMERVAKIESFLEYLESDNALVRRAAIEEGIASDDRMMREAAIKAGFQSSDPEVKKEAMIAVLKSQVSWLVEVDQSSVTSESATNCAQTYDRKTVRRVREIYDSSEFQLSVNSVGYSCRVLGEELICTSGSWVFTFKTRPDGAFGGTFEKLGYCSVNVQLRNF